MLPGFSAELMPKGREKESQAKIKRYMTMMDSMTNEGELNFWLLSDEFSCMHTQRELLYYCFAFS